MFSITRTGNHLDFEFGGKVDPATMRKILDEFVAKSEGIEHGSMLYRVNDFSLPTPGAVALELSRMPKLLRVMRRFHRTAVLADQRWLRTASEWEGKLFPGLEIRAFPRDQEDTARQWLKA